MALRDVIFGAQKQASRQAEVIVEFVEEYLRDVCNMNTAAFQADIDWQNAIGAALVQVIDDIKYPSSITSDDNYVSPAKWFFVRLFLGIAAVDDICAHSDCEWDIDSTTQDNEKVVFYAYMSADEAGDELDPDVPQTVDSSEADRIVEKVISYCPPSEREKLPADDKLAAVLLSQSYWRGKF